MKERALHRATNTCEALHRERRVRGVEREKGAVFPLIPCVSDLP